MTVSHSARMRIDPRVDLRAAHQLKVLCRNGSPHDCAQSNYDGELTNPVLPGVWYFSTSSLNTKDLARNTQPEVQKTWGCAHSNGTRNTIRSPAGWDAERRGEGQGDDAERAGAWVLEGQRT